jgi:CubicO group peptidase (beta-lactamase class C family)
MQLVERGKILITEPLSKYIPEYANMTVKHRCEDGSTEIRPAKNPILIKHLFSMSAGFNYNLDAPAIKRVKEEKGGSPTTLDVIRALAEEPLEFEPGTEYRYSLCHDVLGAVIEIASGERLGDYMKKNIFDPLGMKDTTFDCTPDIHSRIASQYQYDRKNGVAIEIPNTENRYRFGANGEYQSGGAGLISSVDDYILLADALANLGVGKNGARILSSRAVNLMRKNQLNDYQLSQFRVKAHLMGYGYALGVRTNMVPEEAGNLAPLGEFGWDGARSAYFSADPENRLAVYYGQHLDGFHEVLHTRLRNVIYSCLDED